MIFFLLCPLHERVPLREREVLTQLEARCRLALPDLRPAGAVAAG